MPLGYLPEKPDAHRSMLNLASQYGVTKRTCWNSAGVEHNKIMSHRKSNLCGFWMAPGPSLLGFYSSPCRLDVVLVETCGPWFAPCHPIVAPLLSSCRLHVLLGLVRLVVISYGSRCSVMTSHPSFVASIGLYGFIDVPKFRSSSFKQKAFRICS